MLPRAIFILHFCRAAQLKVGLPLGVVKYLGPLSVQSEQLFKPKLLCQTNTELSIAPI